MPFEWDPSNECIICLDTFDPLLNDTIVIGNCLHKFHSECLKNYILRTKNALKENILIL